MSQPPQRPPRTFGLGALFEWIAGLALVLALVTQLQQPGFLCAFFGLMVLVAAHSSIFAQDHQFAMGNNKSVAVFLILLLTMALASLIPLALATNQPVPRVCVLLSAELVFVTYAITRRVRIAGRMQHEGEHD